MHIIPAPVQFEPLHDVEFTWPERAEVGAASSEFELAEEATYLVAGAKSRSLHQR